MTPALRATSAISISCIVLLLLGEFTRNRYGSFNVTSTSPRFRRTAPYDASLRRDSAFCQTDPGLRHEIVDTRKNVNKRSCVGQCGNTTHFVVRDAAVIAPKMLSLCLMNPFHGFYDCIWPLLHYLSACRPDHPPVVVNNAIISENRRSRWSVRARGMFLKNSEASSEIIDLGSLREGECICFRSLMTFRKTTLWRPTRFQYRQSFGNHEVLAPHPALLKRDALRLFRESILKSYGIADERQRNVTKIVVYGRHDAPRRRWLNQDQYMTNLSARLPTGFEVTSMKKVAKAFEQQVLDHSEADILIAPHGAAMVNTLFMREGATVLEIASRQCIDLGNTRTATDLNHAVDPTDPNTWVPWHAQSLGLYHLVAPCYVPSSGARNGDFVTDNSNLVNLTLLALTFQSRHR